jgi:hypothetical protein
MRIYGGLVGEDPEDVPTSLDLAVKSRETQIDALQNLDFAPKYLLY